LALIIRLPLQAPAPKRSCKSIRDTVQQVQQVHDGRLNNLKLDPFVTSDINQTAVSDSQEAKGKASSGRKETRGFQ
jgi:hypothetical protein